MVIRAPNSIAWPCKKLIPCKSKRRSTRVVCKSVMKRRNGRKIRSVEAFVEIDLTSQGKNGSTLNSKQTNSPKNIGTMEEYLRNSNLKMNDSEKTDRKESLVPSNIKSKKEDDDVETDDKTIEWYLIPLFIPFSHMWCQYM
uniref:Uncharacterized protein n=1 Tax=Theileria annulata TaxID=5874 RepID=A0A3B0MXV0_THEAN